MRASAPFLFFRVQYFHFFIFQPGKSRAYAGARLCGRTLMRASARLCGRALLFYFSGYSTSIFLFFRSTGKSRKNPFCFYPTQKYAHFFKKLPKMEPKKYLNQNIYNKAQIESPKYLHQTTFETLKYLQQTIFWMCLFRPKCKRFA